jgi:hypothetical protein
MLQDGTPNHFRDCSAPEECGRAPVVHSVRCPYRPARPRGWWGSLGTEFVGFAALRRAVAVVPGQYAENPGLPDQAESPANPDHRTPARIRESPPGPDVAVSADCPAHEAIPDAPDSTVSSDAAVPPAREAFPALQDRQARTESVGFAAVRRVVAVVAGRYVENPGVPDQG